jgi:hypothetical protein
MSGENLVVYLDANRKTLSSNGVSIASGAIAVAAAANYDVIADGAGYPDGSFVLTGSFASAPVENTTLSLYAQPLGIDDGPLDAQAPETTRPTMVIGSFVLNNVAGQQSILLNAYDLPRKAAYWLYNNSTGQALAVGWTLKVTPRTFKVAS